MADDGRESVPSLPPTSASDKVAVVVNGNAKQVTDDLVEILDQIVQSGDLFVSRSLDEGRDIARTIVDRGYPTVLTGGGDGTFVQMVTWVMREAKAKGKPLPRFGLLKLGTGNALAWVLGAQNPQGRGVVADLARLRKEGGRRFLRLLEVEGTLTPFCGLGVDAISLHNYIETKEALAKIPGLARYAPGALGYAVSIIGRSMPEFLFRPHPVVKAINEGAPVERMGMDGRPVGKPIEQGEVIYEGPARMVSAGTIPYWGFGARIFPYANEREDRFHLRLADPSPAQVAINIQKIWNGTYRADNVHDFLVERCSLHFEKPQPMQVGGDPVGVRQVVNIALSPELIPVVDYYAPPPVV